MSSVTPILAALMYHSIRYAYVSGLSCSVLYPTWLEKKKKKNNETKITKKSFFSQTTIICNQTTAARQQ